MTLQGALSLKEGLLLRPFDKRGWVANADQHFSRGRSVTQQLEITYAGRERKSTFRIDSAGKGSSYSIETIATSGPSHQTFVFLCGLLQSQYFDYYINDYLFPTASISHN